MKAHRTYPTVLEEILEKQGTYALYTSSREKEKSTSEQSTEETAGEGKRVVQIEGRLLTRDTPWTQREPLNPANETKQHGEPRTATLSRV